MTTGYAFVPSPGHIYSGHPESPARFDVLQPRLTFFAAQPLQVIPATMDEILRVHSHGMVRSLEEACKEGEAIIDLAPTYVTRTSFTDARLAAGATLECTRRVLSGDVHNALAIVRPPGHHAEPDHSMGFCLLNNIAVAARDALAAGIRRIAIVDYDAHHGNGTQAAFLDEDNVAYLSTHQWGIYPGTGWFQDAPGARGRIVNVPLPAGSGNRVYERITEEIMGPFVEHFRPELLLVSVGFDAHWNDPITSLGLSSESFRLLAVKLKQLADEQCSGRIVFVLEGGYEASNLYNGVAGVFSALTGAAFADPLDASPRPEPDVEERLEAVKSLHGF